MSARFVLSVARVAVLAGAIGCTSPPIVQTPAPSPASPSPLPSVTVPTPVATATIDLTGRVTEVIVGGSIRAATYLLAGSYWVTEDVTAGASMCSTVVTAADAFYVGDYHASMGNLINVAFTGITLSPGGSGHTAGLKSFPRATYRFLADAYNPLGPPEGNGQAKLCEDWTMTLSAR